MFEGSGIVCGVETARRYRINSTSDFVCCGLVSLYLVSGCPFLRHSATTCGVLGTLTLWRKSPVLRDRRVIPIFFHPSKRVNFLSPEFWSVQPVVWATSAKPAKNRSFYAASRVGAVHRNVCINETESDAAEIHPEPSLRQPAFCPIKGKNSVDLICQYTPDCAG